MFKLIRLRHVRPRWPDDTLNQVIVHPPHMYTVLKPQSGCLCNDTPGHHVPSVCECVCECATIMWCSTKSLSIQFCLTWESWQNSVRYHITLFCQEKYSNSIELFASEIVFCNGSKFRWNEIEKIMHDRKSSAEILVWSTMLRGIETFILNIKSFWIFY